MRYGIAAGVLIAALATSAAHCKPAKRPVRPTRSAVATRPIPQAAMIEAMTEVDSCAGKATPGRPVELCNRTWKGIKWLLYSNWNGQLDTPAGGRWLVSCKYDAIEREDLCSFSTGDQFFIARSDGYATAVFWGLQRYPGSEMTYRFDDSAPISTTAESWSAEQSRSIYRRMMAGKIMRYRFSDWPNNASHDGSIDLAGFADTAALMEAIRDQFTIARVLKKIDVPE